MVSIWIIVGLIIATISVSSLAAFFSIVGLAALFSGAWIAVCAMAGSLELAKFVLAAYLHQQWGYLNKTLRTYLSFAIVTLSLITSMGIFGFMSDAYQSASHAIETEQTKLKIEEDKQASYKAEIDRLTMAVDEIPDTRITKKLKARQEIEPMIRDLNSKIDESTKISANLNLNVLEIKKKVGPLIYISKAFNLEIDATVKYLIFVFVLVFDPLAISLVIATTQAIDSRRHKQKIHVRKDNVEPLKVTDPMTSEILNKDLESITDKKVIFETTPTPASVPHITPNAVPENQIVASHDEPLIEMSFDDLEPSVEKNKVS